KAGAAFTAAAERTRRPLRAKQGARESSGRHRLAHAFGADEQIGVVMSAPRQRAAEKADGFVLPHDIIPHIGSGPGLLALDRPAGGAPFHTAPPLNKASAQRRQPIPSVPRRGRGRQCRRLTLTIKVEEQTPYL